MSLENISEKLSQRTDLSQDEVQHLFQKLFFDDVDENLQRDLLIKWYEKGETALEITEAIRFLKEHGRSVSCQANTIMDCCGTGGDGKNTFNFSTAVAFVLAGGDVTMAKHGNRAVSSKSGSADVLESLGINLNLSPEQSVKCVDEIGIGFFFAPTHYPFLRKIGPIRKSISHRTIFNLLGPLLNPAGATHQMIGVAEEKFVPIHCQVLKELGLKSAVVAHSQDGLDEISLTDKSKLAHLKSGEIQEIDFDPWKETGYPQCSLTDITGGTSEENALRLRQALKGHSEPLDHMVHLNAAWGFIAAEKTDNIMDGLLLAQESISSGKAYQKLEELVELSNDLK